MPSQDLSEIQYGSFELSLPKKFLKQTHLHPLLIPIKGFDEAFLDDVWKNESDLMSFYFGGAYGTQFTTVEQIVDFSKTFNDLLERKGIAKHHSDSLLYLAMFVVGDWEKQNMEHHTQNQLKDYADFITDLYAAGSHDLQRRSKDKSYIQVIDPSNNEIFFAKAILAKTMSLEEVSVYLPGENNKEDIVRYMRIKIGLQYIYVPEDLNPILKSLSKLHSTSGEKIDSIQFPKQFKRELLTFTLQKMMKMHEDADTKFYKLFQKEVLDHNALIGYYKSYRKNKFSNVRVLSKIGIIVGDYLKSEKVLKTKTSIADFLWEYFMLLKLYQVKGSIPENYKNLKEFYVKNGITSESIRLMMKDAEKFGDF